MKKTTQIFSLFLLLTIGFISCKSGGGDPKAVLKDFFEHLAKKDIDGAAKLATKDSKSTLDMVKKGMDMAAKMDTLSKKEDPAEEFKNAEFSEAKISGDTAYVTVSNKTKQQPSASFTLVKEAGQWKVDFSMAALMKMGAKSMNPENEGGSQQVPSVTPEQMDQVQKAADSLLKNADPKKIEELQKRLENAK